MKGGNDNDDQDGNNDDMMTMTISSSLTDKCAFILHCVSILSTTMNSFHITILTISLELDLMMMIEMMI